MTAVADTRSRLGYAPVIGLEVHAQVLTQSKMFCSCSARYSGAIPNSHVCPTCLGLPGSLPVINEAGLENAVMVGLALNCEITSLTRFDRKNYPYPDIPKGYQITQYDAPLARQGWIEVGSGGSRHRIGITRVHLEEDTGKTIHAQLGGREVALVDYNRSGVPLLEIVSQPDIESSLEARAYFAALREILVYLGVNSGDMQEGALRADVNVSVRRGESDQGVKSEIKNLNSFRSVQRALDFEIERQIDVLEAGGELMQETRGWDEASEMTVPQRSKEFAEDYRYFPEPDLPPLSLPKELIHRIRSSLPELPEAKRTRFVRDYGLSDYDAGVITQEPALARLLEETVRLAPGAEPKIAANWITGEYLRLLHETGIAIAQSRITAGGMAALLKLLADDRITTSIGKTVFLEMFNTGQEPEAIVSARGLTQVSDRSELEGLVQTVLDENPRLVADYIHKDRKTEGPLVGKVMAATKGKANAAIVKEIIAALIAATAHRP